LRNTY